MPSLNQYRSMNHSEIKRQKIIKDYQLLFIGERKAMPKGTWEDDKNVIIIFRFVVEIKEKLVEEEIPLINRNFIKKHKLWGLLNRYKSIKRIIQFVYPNTYDVFDFSRVPVGYWDCNKNIKQRLEYFLEKSSYTISDIPKVLTYDRLVEWGFSAPLKKYGHSPFRLINKLYPNMFTPHDFRKVPQGSAVNKPDVTRQFLKMLKAENITFEEIPDRVTQQLLNEYRLNGTLKHFNNSPAKMIKYLFPNQFNSDEFIKSNRYWYDKQNVKRAINNLIEKYDISHQDIPKRITKSLLMQEGLYGLLHAYNGSPIAIINTCFPKEFDIFEFTRVPNRYWYKKENRINALRSYCKKKNIHRDKLSNLSRAYFKKKLPRFISVVDRHYESKLYLWIMEAFPEYEFKPEDFSLHVGIDGQLCDSKEELLLHNFFVNNLVNATVRRESVRLVNHKEKETYIPDWIIKQADKEYIVEYFGLYNSNRFPGYDDKVYRKLRFYKKLSKYKKIMIFPKNLYTRGFKGIENLMEKEGLKLRKDRITLL